MDHTNKRVYNQILNLSAFRFLNTSIMYGFKLRKQYRMTIINAILNGNPENINYAIDFIRHNLPTILKSYVLCSIMQFLFSLFLYFLLYNFTFYFLYYKQSIPIKTCYLRAKIILSFLLRFRCNGKYLIVRTISIGKVLLKNRFL